MDGSCSDDSEFEEERAGGGPGPSRRRAGSRRTGGGSGPTTSIRSAGGAFTNRMTAENTRRASGHCMCTLHMHMFRYDHPEVILTLFRSIEFSNMSLSNSNDGNKRVGNFRCCIQALKLNHVCCCFTSASGLDSLFIRHTRL